jgi:cation diffusion facilitator CzcD-associated flavoprotein CzcO
VVTRIDVAVIGGGFSGLMAAARLKERGLTDLRILEAGGDFGGTWYWNRYPGAQCDIESYCYLPLLEETGYMPKEKYSYAPEIFEHTQSRRGVLRAVRARSVSRRACARPGGCEEEASLAASPPTAATTSAHGS